MTEEPDPKRYRPNVGLALFHKNGLVFLAKRIATEGPYQWQMPQGGVDRGEKPADAALRELEEEIGVSAEHVDLLEETADWLYYEFPIDVRTKMKPRGRYLGQRQKWYAFRFKGRDADIRLDTHTPEFVDWRWAPLQSAPGLVIPFKRPVYEEVAQRFRSTAWGLPSDRLLDERRRGVLAVSGKIVTPVVFVHGAFCGGWAFDAFREPFEAAGFETHAPNLPHHERGADLEQLAQTGLKDYAHAISLYARNLRAPPVLVGHSLGGLVSQLAAIHTPIAGLVLLAPSSPWGVPPTTLDEHTHHLGLSLLGDYWRRAVPPDYRVARTTTLDRLTRDNARQTFARFVPESGRAIREAVQWWLDHSMASQAPVYRINAPVLGLAGGKDRVNPSSTVRRVIARFPGEQAHFHEFPQMSHWLVGEPEAADVAQLTLRWFEARDILPKPAKAKRKQLSLFGWREAPA